MHHQSEDDQINFRGSRGAPPESRLYNDSYFSDEGGIAETLHVYAAGNSLPERWQSSEKNRPFHIAENGFGTGLNFITTAALFYETAAARNRLHYSAVEKHPLQPADISRVLSEQFDLYSASEPERSYELSRFRELSDQFIAHYIQNRFNTRLLFAGGWITLDLYFEDTAALWPRLRLPVDAWYFDGFSPAVNPGMWSDQLFQNMAGISREGATFATFTSAAAVRKNLEQAGFRWQKREGFGRKKHMLSGLYSGDSRQNYSTESALKKPQVAVIGAGIAGLCVAEAFKRRGIDVAIFSDNRVKASENPAGLIMPAVALQRTPLLTLSYKAMTYARSFYAQLDRAYAETGVLFTARSEKDKDRFYRYVHNLKTGFNEKFIPETETADTAGLKLNSAGLYFKYAGVVYPSKIIAGLEGRFQITEVEIERILRTGNGFNLHSLPGGINTDIYGPYDIVIICNNTGFNRFAQSSEIRLQPVRGQITELNAPVNGGLESLKTAIAGNIYLTPPVDNRFILGASFIPDDTATETRDTETLELLMKLKQLTGLEPGLKTVVNTRVALRSFTADRLPVAGELPDYRAMRAFFRENHRNSDNEMFKKLPRQKGLYALNGLGSRGFTTAPYLAESLVAQICREAHPPPPELDPARFYLKKLRQMYIKDV